MNAFTRVREAVVKTERCDLKRSQDQVTNWLWGVSEGTELWTVSDFHRLEDNTTN